MSDEDNDIIESENDETEEVLNTEEVEETTPEVETEDTSALEEKNRKLFERAKKAEAEVKELRAKVTSTPAPATEVAPEKQDVTLTPMDAILLGKKNITEKEDIEEVLAFAGYRKLPVSDVLEDKTLQSILRDRAEQRQTAEATNTGNARRGSAKLSADQVLANAEKGKFPEDPEALAEARMATKLNN